MRQRAEIAALKKTIKEEQRKEINLFDVSSTYSSIAACKNISLSAMIRRKKRRDLREVRKKEEEKRTLEKELSVSKSEAPSTEKTERKIVIPSTKHLFHHLSNEKQADKTIFRTTQRTNRILQKLCVRKRSIQPFFAYHNANEEEELGHGELPSTTRSNNSSVTSEESMCRSMHSKSRSSS